MLNKMILIGALAMLAGCAGTLDKIKNTTLQSAYFTGNLEQTYDCINAEAMQRHFYLENDDPLPGGTKRFNLLKGDKTVANLDMSKSDRQTEVNFFYDERDTALASELSGLIQYCKKELD